MSITSDAGTLNFPFLVFDTFRFPAGGDVFVRHARNKRQLSTMIQRYVCVDSFLRAISRHRPV